MPDTTWPWRRTIGGWADHLRISSELVRRDLKLRYAGSLMGSLWSIGIPALNALVLGGMFSVLMSGRMGAHYESVPFILFYFAGFAPWLLFADAVGRSPSVISDNAAIVKRVRFPLETLCLQIVGTTVIAHLVVLAACMVCLIAFRVPPTPRLALLPLLLLITVCLTLGACLILSALAVFIRDLVHLVPVGINLLFFLTPVLYPPTLLQPAPRWVRFVLLDLNPLHHMVEAYRSALLGVPGLDPWGLAYFAAFSLTSLWLGSRLFRRLKVAFSDVL